MNVVQVFSWDHCLYQQVFRCMLDSLSNFLNPIRSCTEAPPEEHPLRQKSLQVFSCTGLALDISRISEAV
jgi:hypothetical protein